MATQENTSSKRKSTAAKPKKVSRSQVLDKAMGAAATASAGFDFLKTIIEAVGELSESNPRLAKGLAAAGSYLASGHMHKSLRFQDYIDDVQEGGAA